MEAIVAHQQSVETVVSADVDGELLAAKKQLLKFREKQTEYFMKAASKVLELKESLQQGGRDKLASWLQKEVGFSIAEARSYLSFDHGLKKKEESFLAGKTSPEAIRALVKCDEKTRSECFVIVERGDHIDARKIERIRRANVLATLSAEQTARMLRRNMFSKAARHYGTAIRISLEREANELLAVIDQTHDVPNHKAGHKVSLEEDERARAAVSEKATELTTKLEALFPVLWAQDRDFDNLTGSGVAGASLAHAWHMLRKLQRGSFYPKRGQAMKYDPSGTRACVEFLAGKRSSALSMREEAHVAPRIFAKPTFVDIDAGVGGTALGLQAAGFEAVAVFAGEIDGLAAINSNRQSWGVKDVAELGASLKSLSMENVDLLTSGLPWHHHKTHDRHGRGRQKIYQTAVEAVKIIRPKAFLFETLDRDIDSTTLSKPFKDKGYDVRWHTVDVSSYGVAQSKPRVVMVGARDGFLNELSMPVIDPPRTKFVEQTIGDLLDKYIEAATENRTQRSDLKEKISEWRGRWEHEFAPPFPNRREPRRLRDWWNLGIDIEEYDNNPPTLEALGTRFKLNNDMLKRLQTFPELWDVEGPSSSNSKLLESALPPVAAKMIGLAIHSALTGLAFDYRPAVKRALLRPRYVSVSKGDREFRELPTYPVSEFVADLHQAFRDREFEHAQKRGRRIHASIAAGHYERSAAPPPLE